MNRKIEFNSGFIIAIALFLEHKQAHGQIISKSMNLSGALDHLRDLEIPEILSTKLKNKIKKAQQNVFNAYGRYMCNDITNEQYIKLFKDFEDILIKVDKEIFNLKPKVYYR